MPNHALAILLFRERLLHLRFTSRGRVLLSLALVVGLLCGLAEPLSSDFQDQSRLSHGRRDVLAIRTLGAISVSRPAKLRSGRGLRKNRSQAVVTNLSAVPILRASRAPSVTLDAHLAAGNIFAGSVRSPPCLTIKELSEIRFPAKAQASRVPGCS